MFKCLSQFSCEDGVFIKGGVYDSLPNNSKYHGLFEEIESPKKRVEIQGEEVETASIKPPKRKRKKK